jgi:hypothetical protein
MAADIPRSYHAATDSEQCAPEMPGPAPVLKSIRNRRRLHVNLDCFRAGHDPAGGHIELIGEIRGAPSVAAVAGEAWQPVDQARAVLLPASGGEPSEAAAVRGHGASHSGATRDWVGRGAGRSQWNSGEVPLASFGRSAAVEKCSGSSGRKLSELAPDNSGLRKGRSVYTELLWRTDNGNPG